MQKIGKFLLLIFLSIIWLIAYIHLISAWSLPNNLQQQKIIITGFVASIPKDNNHHVSFEFDLEKINNQLQHSKILLSWYYPHPYLLVGSKWQLLVMLKKPHGFADLASFDYEKYLFVHHIRAVGYVINSNFNHKLPGKKYKCFIANIRQQLATKLMELSNSGFYANTIYINFIIALLLGIRSGINAAQFQVFRDTGTSHLFAISGLHIGLVFGFCYVFFKFLWSRSYRLMLFMPAQKAASLIALTVVFCYALLAGFSLPTQRALIMLAILLLGLFMQRNLRPFYGWLLALICVLIVNPLVILLPSFYLSFAAVAILLYIFTSNVIIEKTFLKNIWHKFIKAQIYIIVGLAPLVLYFFQQISLVSILANFVAIPIIGFIVLPVSLMAFLMMFVAKALASWILLIAITAMKILWIYLQWLANKNLVWQHAIFNNWILIAAIIAVVLFLLPKKLFPSKLVALWILPLFFYFPPRPHKAQVWFTLVDVGQGLATLVETSHHTLIYDAGPKFSPDFDAGKAVIVPMLHQLNLTYVDMLVISHGDNDHIGGANSILHAVKVDQIKTSVPKKFPHLASFCKRGEHFSWDGVDFNFLSPTANNQFSGNDASCVLKITIGKNSILLTGDIGKAAERFLVENEPNLSSTILVAPHHGSSKSFMTSFVKAVNPNYVLYPVGYLNRYDFPGQETITGYQKIYARQFNTIHSGAITFSISPNKIVAAPIEYRIKHHEFWNSIF